MKPHSLQLKEMPTPRYVLNLCYDPKSYYSRGFKQTLLNQADAIRSRGADVHRLHFPYTVSSTYDPCSAICDIKLKQTTDTKSDQEFYVRTACARFDTIPSCRVTLTFFPLTGAKGMDEFRFLRNKHSGSMKPHSLQVKEMPTPKIVLNLCYDPISYYKSRV